jgi:hypothetical protein
MPNTRAVGPPFVIFPRLFIQYIRCPSLLEAVPPSAIWGCAMSWQGGPPIWTIWRLSCSHVGDAWFSLLYAILMEKGWSWWKQCSTVAKTQDCWVNVRCHERNLMVPRKDYFLKLMTLSSPFSGEIQNCNKLYYFLSHIGVLSFFQNPAFDRYSNSCLNFRPQKLKEWCRLDLRFFGNWFLILCNLSCLTLLWHCLWKI